MLKYKILVDSVSSNPFSMIIIFLTNRQIVIGIIHLNILSFQIRSISIHRLFQESLTLSLSSLFKSNMFLQRHLLCQFINNINKVGRFFTYKFHQKFKLLFYRRFSLFSKQMYSCMQRKRFPFLTMPHRKDKMIDSKAIFFLSSSILHF